MQSPARMSPAELVLRCYVRQSGRRRNLWVAHCVDWDLWAVGPTSEAAQSSLEDSIHGYARALFETDDESSIPRLLRRRSPLRYVVFWHLLRIVAKMTGNGRLPLGGRPFDEMPYRLSPA